MKQNIFKRDFVLFSLAVILVSFVFYWYQIRPENIRKNCQIYAVKKTPANGMNVNLKRRNNFYRECLVKNGRKPESLYVNLQE